jgi:hypothetical protein
VRDELVDQSFTEPRLGSFRATTDSDYDHPIAENVLNRNFEALGPNEKWAANIS